MVAELSNNHNGSLDRALRLIDAAQAAGASAIKIQCYSPADLVRLRGDGPAPAPWNRLTMRALYEQAQTPIAWLPAVFAYCEAQGIPIFSSVFGVDGFRALEDVGNPAYKLAALDFARDELRAMVAATGKPILRSCHADYAPAVTDAFMLYCPPGYPQIDIRFKVDSGYRGFSYHGTDWLQPARAQLCGAELIECHVQLDDEPSALEANVSLTIAQFARLVAAVRQTEWCAA